MIPINNGKSHENWWSPLWMENPMKIDDLGVAPCQETPNSKVGKDPETVWSSLDLWKINHQLLLVCFRILYQLHLVIHLLVVACRRMLLEMMYFLHDHVLICSSVHSYAWFTRPDAHVWGTVWSQFRNIDHFGWLTNIVLIQSPPVCLITLRPFHGRHICFRVVKIQRFASFC